MTPRTLRFSDPRAEAPRGLVVMSPSAGAVWPTRSGMAAGAPLVFTLRDLSVLPDGAVRVMITVAGQVGGVVVNHDDPGMRIESRGAGCVVTLRLAEVRPLVSHGLGPLMAAAAGNGVAATLSVDLGLAAEGVGSRRGMPHGTPGQGDFASGRIPFTLGSP